MQLLPVTWKSRHLLLEIVIALLVAAFAGWLTRTIFFHSYLITDQSMAPKLLPGDRILTNRLKKKITFGFWKPDVFSVVVFKHPSDNQKKSIKRIIAGSGDILEIRKKILIVNGKTFPASDFIMDMSIERDPTFDPRDNFQSLEIPSPGDTLILSTLGLREFDYAVSLIKQELNEPGIQITCKLMINGKPIDISKYKELFKYTLNADNSPDLTKLPWYHLKSFKTQLSSRFPDMNIDFQQKAILNGEELILHVVKNPCYFVMGDNWEDSYDSRYWGYVNRKSIISKPLLIFWSQKPSGGLKINFKRLLRFVK